MTRKIIPGERASIEFTGILNGGGGPQVECGFCGREHYAIDSHLLTNHIMDEDEIDRYLASINHQAATSPDDVILHYDVTYVDYSEIDGQPIVDDCKCNGLRRYENFFWNNRNIFKDYMMHRKLRAQAEVDDIGNIENYKV